MINNNQIKEGKTSIKSPSPTYKIFLEEIKWRFFYVFIGYFFGIIIAYYQKDNIIQALTRPLNSEIISQAFKKNKEVFSKNEIKDFLLENNFHINNFLNQPFFEIQGKEDVEEISKYLINELLIKDAFNFVQLNITEAFTTQIQIAFLLAFFVSIPLFQLQTYFFFCPGLYWKEQKLLISLGVFSWIFLSIALFFTQEQLLPQAWYFFLSFGEDSNQQNLAFIPSLGPYVKIFMEIIFAIIISFQLPLFFFLLIHWGWMGKNFLVKSRSQVILGLLFWAALISPPDLWSQIFIFIPLFFIQEMSLYFLFCTKYFQDITQT